MPAYSYLYINTPIMACPEIPKNLLHLLDRKMDTKSKEQTGLEHFQCEDPVFEANDTKTGISGSEEALVEEVLEVLEGLLG